MSQNMPLVFGLLFTGRPSTKPQARVPLMPAPWALEGKKRISKGKGTVGFVPFGLRCDPLKRRPVAGRHGPERPAHIPCRPDETGKNTTLLLLLAP